MFWTRKGLIIYTHVKYRDIPSKLTFDWIHHTTLKCLSAHLFILILLVLQSHHIAQLHMQSLILTGNREADCDISE